MNINWDSTLNEYFQRYPIILIDVGSRRGLLTRWKQIARYCKAFGFEPDKKAFAELQFQDNITYFNIGLYSEPGKRKFYLTSKRGKSSLFKPNRPLLNDFSNAKSYDIVKVEEIETDTLDRQIQAHCIGDTDFIKVDTQGSELFILQGGSNVLKESVFGIEVEVQFAQIYEQTPLFADVDQYLRKFEFQLFELEAMKCRKRIKNRRGVQQKGQIFTADALYFRTLGSFRAVIENIRDEAQRRAKILRAITICLLYEYADYACSLYDSFANNFLNGEKDLIQQTLYKHTHPLAWRIPDFRGRRYLARKCYLLWNMINPDHQKDTIVKYIDSYH